MTEKDILRVIRNADVKFYEEAEQETLQTNTPAIRRNVTRRIIAVASAAAVLAVSVSAGIYASRNKGLTVGKSQGDMESIVEQVTNVRTDTMQTALPAASANELGGHGPIRIGVNNLIMMDDENWYINTSAAAISDKEYLKLNALGEAEKEHYDYLTCLYPDRCGSGEYYHYDPETRTVSLWNGTETTEKLFTLKMYTQENTSMDDDIFTEQYEIDLFFIAKLSDHQYLCSGYAINKSTQGTLFFRHLQDLEGDNLGSCIMPEELNGTAYLPPINILSDGAQGIYVDDSRDSVYGRPLQHISADHLGGEKLDIRLDEVSGLWNGALYTLDVHNSQITERHRDYVRFDLETGERTMLLEDVDWADARHNYMFHGDKLFVAGADSIQIMDTDLQNSRTIQIDAPARLDITFVAPMRMDLCGDTLFIEYRCAGMDETPVYVLCDITTGKVQYVTGAEIDSEEQPETTETTPEQTALTETTTQTTQTETTAQQANPDGTNYLGGHGELKHFPRNDCMWDDDCWYENMRHSALKSDAKYLPRERTAFDYPDAAGNKDFMDLADNTIYRLHRSAEFPYITTLNPDGTETEVFPNLTEPFSRSGEKYDVDNLCIENLGNGYYFIDAKLLPHGADPEHEKWIDVWEIYNTADDTANGQVEREFSYEENISFGIQRCADGATGMFISYELWFPPSHSKVIRIEHRTADGKSEIVLETDISSNAWFAYNGCIYYVSYGDQNYCKYNLKTKETTVLIQNTGWNLPETGSCNLWFVDGTVYVIKDGGTLVYGDPEMQEQHEWKIEYPETMEVFADFCFVEGVCDNVVFIVNSDAQFSPEVNSGDDDDAGVRMYSRHNYSILYHTDTGKVQFIYNPDYYTPPTEN